MADKGTAHLRLVYSRPRLDPGEWRAAVSVERFRAVAARWPVARSVVSEDWPSWLTGAALWKLAVLAAALTVLLVVGRQRSSSS